ncbi:site-2 protease family protein [Altericista sp. CCNU0014]|uniref:site-2 protease family protein n=1 Tax=Altericista sp. CCNU0014 TaxID=3082949 RepID=UPI00384CB883
MTARDITVNFGKGIAMQGRTRSGWQVGSIFGIPLIIDSSWLFIVGLVTLANGLAWQEEYSTWEAWQAWGAGFVMALLLFASVLLHELGHSLVAKSQGTKVNSITLFLFGGIASIDSEAKTPGKAFWVAIAGPLVSLGLFGLLGGASRLIAQQTPWHVISNELSHMNLVLALFNLIPGLPLDGGQILKALIWKVTGNRFKGVHWAARMGQALGLLAIVLGMSATLMGQAGGIWIALLGWFGLRSASSYDRFTDLQEGLLKLQAKDAMTRDFRVVDAEQSVRAFADSYVVEANHAPAYFAASGGRYRGLVNIDDLNTLERSEWEQRRVREIARSFADIPTVRETTSLPEVIQRLEQEQIPFITVLSPADAVSGIVDRGDIVRAVGAQMNLQIPSEDILRIKQEGAFPASFQLQAIAKAVLPDPNTKSP